MKRNLLLSAAAIICLSCSAALADPPTDNGQKSQDQSKQQGKGQGAGKGQNQGQAQRPVQSQAQRPVQSQGQAQRPVQSQAQRPVQSQGQAQRPVQSQAQRPVQSQAQRPVQSQAQRPVQSQSQVQRGGYGATAGAAKSAGSGAGAPVTSRQVKGAVTPQQGQTQAYPGAPGGGATGAQTQQGRSRVTPRPPALAVTRPPANTPALSGWTRGVTGPARTQEGQQWRRQHSGWDSHAVWRRNSNWWRGNSAFRYYAGVRTGFFFIPGFGYLSPPAQYRSHRWRAGDILPSWFWRYQVRDYWNYGLPQPPYGCAWVWVNNNVALIDMSDGYIVDIVYNVW